MKKRLLLVVLGATMALGCMTACGSNSGAQANTTAAVESTAATENTTAVESTKAAEVTTYEFDTFDGLKVVINEGNIVSQEACEQPLEWKDLPKDAEQIAPGRDCILFADSTNYYVEDVTNKLVTVAFMELGDLIEDTGVAIFDNNVFSFVYDPECFTVVEAEDCVTVSYYDEKVQTAGANTITFSKFENTDSEKVVKSCMELYGAADNEMVENYLAGEKVKGYSYSTGILETAGSELKTAETVHAVPSGADVILIDKLRTYGNDMELENAIDALLDEVILSFKLD